MDNVKTVRQPREGPKPAVVGSHLLLPLFGTCIYWYLLVHILLK